MSSPKSLTSSKTRVKFWNNWNASINLTQVGSDSDSETETQCTIQRNIENPKFRNWIPPSFFIDGTGSHRGIIVNESEKESSKKKFFEEKNIGNAKNELNVDWGKRELLHNISNLSYEDLIWGVVNLGVFGCIKLWTNNYGNLCGYAEGTITSFESCNKAALLITNTDLLRKMLSVSSAQWTTLCEIVTKSRACLKFDAFKNIDLNNASSIEKMWFFLCKRRHFLPDKCMLVKYNGVMKCLKELDIIPKIVVQDIRNIEGHCIN